MISTTSKLYVTDGGRRENNFWFFLFFFFFFLPLNTNSSPAGVAPIKMHACYGDALNWMAPLYVKRGLCLDSRKTKVIRSFGGEKKERERKKNTTSYPPSLIASHFPANPAISEIYK